MPKETCLGNLYVIYVPLYPLYNDIIDQASEKMKLLAGAPERGVRGAGGKGPPLPFAFFRGRGQRGPKGAKEKCPQ